MLVLIVIMLVSCGKPAISIETFSPAESITPTLTMVSMPKTTPSPTITSTAIPTLTVEQARTRLLDLLASNGDCALPCLWGITPGVSNYQDARTILEPLISISRSTHFGAVSPDDISPLYIEGDLTIGTTVAYLYAANDGVVNSIAFQVNASQENSDGYIDVFDSEIFGKHVGAYALSHILSEHGVPEAVLVSTDGGGERGKNVPGFYMLLFYPDQGLLVSYTTYRQLVDGNVRGCLANAHIELRLFSAGRPDTFAKGLAQTKWKNLWPVPADSPHWKSVDVATSMSLEQFYEIFHQPTEECVDTPVNLWPVSEP